MPSNKVVGPLILLIRTCWLKSKQFVAVPVTAGLLRVVGWQSTDLPPVFVGKCCQLKYGKTNCTVFLKANTHGSDFVISIKQASQLVSGAGCLGKQHGARLPFIILLWRIC